VKLWPRVWCLVFLTHGVDLTANWVNFRVTKSTTSFAGVKAGGRLCDPIWNVISSSDEARSTSCNNFTVRTPFTLLTSRNNNNHDTVVVRVPVGYDLDSLGFFIGSRQILVDRQIDTHIDTLIIILCFSTHMFTNKYLQIYTYLQDIFMLTTT